jgi:hypothetical protein
MKLWLIKQDVNNGYDTYDSAVVAAPTAEAAQQIHPSKYPDWGSEYDCWAKSPDQVTVKYIGEAAKGIGEGVVITSFNAG